jgi:hypothetical protein
MQILITNMNTYFLHVFTTHISTVHRDMYLYKRMQTHVLLISEDISISILLMKIDTLSVHRLHSRETHRQNFVFFYLGFERVLIKNLAVNCNSLLVASTCQRSTINTSNLNFCQRRSKPSATITD